MQQWGPESVLTGIKFKCIECRLVDWQNELSVLNYVFGLIVSITFLITTFSQNQFMVSDGLQYNEVYRILLTVSMELAAILCFMYFRLFNEVAPRLSSAGCALAIVAAVSWGVLAYHFESPTHVSAAIVFNAASLGYILILYALGKSQAQQDAHPWYDAAYKLLAVTTIILAVIYITLYSSAHSKEESWLPEQLALIFFQATQLVYFWYHGFTRPDPRYTCSYSVL